MFLVVLSLILMQACSRQPISETKASPLSNKVRFKLDSSDYSVLTYKRDWFWVFKRGQAADLTTDELTEIEGVLGQAVNEYNAQYQTPDRKGKSDWEITLKGKKRQYIAITNKHGDTEVWVNFFCSQEDSDYWRKEPMVVFDGGTCFFNIKINLTQMTYYDLMVNGYA